MWKVEKVGELSLELKCSVDSGKGATGATYLLKLTLELEGNKSKELLQSQNVSVGADVEFKAESDWQAIQEFQDSDENVQLKVTTGEQESNLKIELKGNKLGLGGGSGTGNIKKNFVCNNSGIKPVSQGWWHDGKDVFTSEMLPLGNRQLMNSGMKPISFSISLKSCEYGESGAVATCDLKLTTGSDLKD